MTVGSPASRSMRPARPRPGGIGYGPRPAVGRPPLRPPMRTSAPSLGPARSAIPSKLPRTPWTLPLLAAGAAVAWWWAKAPGKMPLTPEPGKIPAFARDTSPPYPAEKYDANGLMANIALGLGQAMFYQTVLREAGTFAIWAGQSFLWPGQNAVVAPLPLETPYPAEDPSPWDDPLIVTIPRRSPRPRPEPLPEPFPEPIRNPGPAPSPVPYPVPPLLGRPIGVDFGPNGATRINPASKPPRNVRERKSRNSAAHFIFNAFWETFNQGTEFMDFIESLLDGFGIESRGWKRDIEQLLDILENPDGYDFSMWDFIESLAANHLEDWLVGNANHQLTNQLRDLGINVYGSATPGAGFI